jgi:hypothetical protein
MFGIVKRENPNRILIQLTVSPNEVEDTTLTTNPSANSLLTEASPVAEKSLKTVSDSQVPRWKASSSTGSRSEKCPTRAGKGDSRTGGTTR